MKLIVSILVFFTCSYNTRQKEIKDMPTPLPDKNYSYLALGDSYTIGEAVAPSQNFPSQVVSIVNNKKINLVARIIARTGWTTDELEQGILDADLIDPLHKEYDLVSLLIGVNNQYRGRLVGNYQQEIEDLVKKAIRFAGNRPEKVIVLSIPDWSVTPFAIGRDLTLIAREIDAYNNVNRLIAERYNIHYIDITPWTREAVTDNSLLTNDGLHPSGKEYKRWAEKIAAYFIASL